MEKASDQQKELQLLPPPPPHSHRTSSSSSSSSSSRGFPWFHHHRRSRPPLYPTLINGGRDDDDHHHDHHYSGGGGPSLDLKLSISLDGGGGGGNGGCMEALKWQAAEQIRVAAIEKAYAERVRELTRREIELAHTEFARARAMWDKAREEVAKAERLRENATTNTNTSCMGEITCYSCRQRFRPN